MSDLWVSVSLPEATNHRSAPAGDKLAARAAPLSSHALSLSARREDGNDGIGLQCQSDHETGSQEAPQGRAQLDAASLCKYLPLRSAGELKRGQH